MSFLAPLFLLGAAGLAFPVIFHLIRRTTRQKVPFSSLIFLPPSPPRVTQRSRLEDLLLLALRCIVLALLAFGFARPFLRHSDAQDPSTVPPSRVLVLVDTSASMRRLALWDAAVSRAVAISRAAAPGDELALWTFDRQVRPLVSFSEWLSSDVGTRGSLFGSRLAAVEPGWGSTYLDQALSTAAEGLLENIDQANIGRRRIVLITDLQEGSRVAQLQSFEWPKGIEVATEVVKPRNTGNAGLQLISESSSLPATTQAVVRVRVINSPDSALDRFEVGWARPDGKDFFNRAEAVQALPGQSRTVVLPVPSDPAVSQILLRGDSEDYDNRVYLVPPSAAPFRALYFGSEPATDEKQPLFFVQRAFPATGRLGAQIVPHRPEDVPTSDAVSGASLYFVTERLPAATAKLLRTAAEEGKTILFAARNVEIFTTVAEVLGVSGLGAEEAQVRNYAMLGSVDFGHPVLAPFADPRFSDFTKIHFWKYRRFDDTRLPGVRSVARFDSGDPALVEIPVGRGRVMILASTWRPEDSQLGLSTKFVPLLLSIAELGGAVSRDSVSTTVVGDAVKLSESPSAGVTRVRLPNATEVEIPAGSTEFSQTSAPGIYEFISGGGSSRFVVNLEGAESRTAPLAVESLEAAGMPVGLPEGAVAPSPKRKEQLAAIDAESRQKLWRWLIVGALVVLLGESALAGWQGRRVVSGKEIQV